MVEKATLARPYAKAVFETASAHQQLPLWSDVLGLLAQVIVDPQIKELLNNPRVTHETLQALLKDIVGEGFTAEVGHFVQLLIDNHRITLLPQIATQYEIYRAHALKSMRVELIAAFDVSDAQKDQFTTVLKKRFGHEIDLTCRVDKSLLGGAIVRAGDTVIDGSALGRLNQLADNLI